MSVLRLSLLVPPGRPLSTTSACASALLARARPLIAKQLVPAPTAAGTPAAPSKISMRDRYAQFQAAYPEHTVLMQVGDFYEFYGAEPVRQASALLDIAVCRGGDMTGFPVHRLDSYLGRLLRAGKSVVIADQYSASLGAQPKIDRKVTRIVTPGTVTQENLLESAQNNFLLAIVDDKKANRYGLAWTDVSTGLLVVGEASERTLPALLFKIHPKEALWSHDCEPVAKALEQIGVAASHRIRALDPAATATIRTAHLSALETEACQALLSFVKEAMCGELPFLEEPIRQADSCHMSIDANSFRSLDILYNAVTGERKASLWHVLNDTCTAMGARLLTLRLENPSIERDVIEQRLDVVQTLVQEDMLRLRLAETLSRCYDLPRALQRVLNGGGPRDMRHVALTLQEAMRLKSCVAAYANGAALSPLLAALGSHEALAGEIVQAVSADATTLRDERIIAEGYDAELDSLRSFSVAARVEGLAKAYIAATGVERLKIEECSGDYTIKTPKRDRPALADSALFWHMGDVQHETRFSSAELARLNLDCRENAAKVQQRQALLYEALRERAREQARAIIKCASSLAELDVALGLARVALKHGFTRPVIAEEPVWHVEHGRHPVIDAVLADRGATFTTNSCVLSSPVAIITGPNMGGKSTFLRQNALIAIAAQIGSYVPAAHARLGITDAIYTRIGAADDLSQNRSTFMLEMEQTALILRSATRRSLILMDEVGRGTEAAEGASLAYAIVRKIIDIGARCLFATHYNSLPHAFPLHAIHRWCTSVVIHGGDSISVIPRIVEGVSERSYAVPIARMAGIPEDVLSEAAAHYNKQQR